MSQTATFLNQTVLVTGASSGIGLATTKAFLAQGAAQVYITGRNAERLQQTARQLGDRVTGIVADAADLAQLAALKQQIESDGRTLDALFVNAGVAHYNQTGSTSESEYLRIFDTNVKGLFFTVQTLLPVMKAGGNIVLNASVAANKGMDNMSLYSASKAAVRSFARTWASELRSQKIRVNTISPGVTLTNIQKNGLGLNDEQIAGFDGFLQQACPAGRMASPDEIAAAVLFLASPAASYVNGVELAVDGGFTQI